MKSTYLSIVIAVIILGTTFYFVNTSSNESQRQEYPTAKVNNNYVADNVQNNQVSNVKTENGKQVIEITVRGGYNPKVSNAKAGVPTIIRFKTNNTFDCSSAIRIPSLKVAQMLPSTGDTDIPIDSPQAGVLQGSCGMGMYRFAINFQ